jgi:hypothetical protein
VLKIPKQQLQEVYYTTVFANVLFLPDRPPMLKSRSEHPKKGSETGPLKLLNFSTILGSFQVLMIRNAIGIRNIRNTLKTKTAAFISEMPESMTDL